MDLNSLNIKVRQKKKRTYTKEQFEQFKSFNRINPMTLDFIKKALGRKWASVITMEELRALFPYLKGSLKRPEPFFISFHHILKRILNDRATETHSIYYSDKQCRFYTKTNNPHKNDSIQVVETLMNKLLELGILKKIQKSCYSYTHKKGYCCYYIFSKERFFKFCELYFGKDSTEMNIFFNEGYTNNTLSLYDNNNILNSTSINNSNTTTSISTILSSNIHDRKFFEKKLQFLQEDLNYINENVPFFEKEEFNIKINKGFLTGRTYSAFCSTENRKSSERKDYLTERFGKDNFEEFDIHSSIYRVTYLLNNGVWLDDNIDLYPMMFGKEFDSEEERNAFKLLCMRVYFTKSDKMAISNLKRSVLRPFKKALDEKYGDCTYLTEKTWNQLDAISNFCDWKKEDLSKLDIWAESWMKTQYKKMREIITPINSTIFIHESLIYMDVRKVLKDRGIDCCQCYDGFYLKKGSISKDEFLKIVETCANNYYNEYKLLSDN